MFSRREFLRGGAIASLLTAAPAVGVRAAARAAPPLGYAGLCDTRYPEGDAFLAALAGHPFHVQGIGLDPGAALPAIAAAVAARRPIFGLATDPVLTLAQQLAGRDGYALAFHGVHTHLDDATLEHRLLGDPRVLHALRQTLIEQPERWPDLVARSAPLLVSASARSDKLTQRVLLARRAGSPGHFVSFALVPTAT